MSIFHTFPILKTNRLILKEITQEDLPNLLLMLRDHEVVRYVGITSSHTLEEASRELGWYQSIYQNETGIRFGIYLKDTKQLMGTCGFKDYDLTDRKAEIGYFINQDFWQQGLMTEALYALLDFGFNDFDLNRIHAEVDTRNVASIKLLTKCGFVTEGLMRESEFENNEFIDLFIFSYLKREYRQTK